jgi:UDP-glucose 4-epimerase
MQRKLPELGAVRRFTSADNGNVLGDTKPHRPVRATQKGSVQMALTVAVTGPTGEIGISAVDALERDTKVERILGMARRPFDVAARGWTKTEYRQGDILDRDAVDGLVADADVVIHLAYLIMGSREESRRINLAGTRNVFAATVAALRPQRLVYTSSVAAYGYHTDNPVPITEDVATRGSKEHYYSEQKAECEAVLREVTDGSNLEVYVLRPCIVAGPRATMLADSMPWRQVSDKLPAALRGAAGFVQGLLPLMPDPGIALQLVHHDDVATAIALAATGAGEPGAYNLAADGEISLSDVARATGARAVRVPQAAATAASNVLARLPMVPAAAEWVHTVRSSVVMDTTRAKKLLGWQPEHTSKETLDELAAAL